MPKKIRWIPKRKLVNRDGSFRSCPACGGAVKQRQFGGMLPYAVDPECQKCGTEFTPQRWLFIFRRGFKLVPKVTT